ncbi:insulinase family protein [Streptomyces sp. MUM 136J]|uniref:M16 family metallopeptidase n=1 Tax=Streptomyces sp. MUM 136J TaxID=2791992 RepID=UPI001F048B56|nr:pitrilysin family protein [Streptomyces sp. MUM 136J]MCH0571637.1 insulinase family protein [Streptomyces sp. MUM 136J]
MTTAATSGTIPPAPPRAGTGRPPAGLPPLGTPLPVRPPEAVTRTAANGLRVIAVRRPAVPLAELRLHVPFDGGPAECGATAEVLAATLLGETAGPSALDRTAVDDRVADAGGRLSVRVDPEGLEVSGTALDDGLPGLLDVLGRCLAAPALDPSDVIAERARLLRRIEVARSAPRHLVREALLLRAFGDHPITRETPRADLVAAVEPGAVARLAADRVVPRGSVLAVVGSGDPEATADLVCGALAGWRAGRPATGPTAPPPLRTGPVTVVARPGARQAQIRLAADAPPRTDPGYEALVVANMVFGGFFSSRLVGELRERHGWTYQAQSRLSEHAGRRASLLVEFDTDPDTAGAALRATHEQLAAVAGAVPPTAEEVLAARSHAAGLTALSLSGRRGLARLLVALDRAGLDHHWLPGHLHRLRTVDPDAVRDAARRLAPDRFTGVVSGDPAVLEPRLAALPPGWSPAH